ncbi:UNVERIFIED_CONTAM: hypothetical protein B566_EDAN019523, partial [Ephemera danica]
MQPGLTLVVGPPGTGKTDVAVQIISNIYHNFPAQRTLIVTHSNQALNQLFEKIMALDIDERHLYGRVNFVLAKRLELLTEVQRLQESLEVPGDVAYTCETAGYFFLYHVLARWEQYISKYDNILMEESAQILEIETFIPLLLQNPQDGFSRLKRWIMIGDHHQLPPVIKNMAFQKYSNMEQSLFTRIVRLGVPTVDLDGQGRSRP